MDDDIDCNQVIHALYEFLDDELTGEHRRHVESHLGGCPHCYSAFDFEAELRIVVRTRLAVQMPSTLGLRIVAALEREGFSLPAPGSAGSARDGREPTGPPGPQVSPGPPTMRPPGPPLGGGGAPFGGASPLG